MSTQTLQDANHRIIGYIETMSDGQQMLQDANHLILGYFDPSGDITQDANHRIVGYGNLLMTLLR